MRRYFIAGNWKMNLSRAAAEALAADLVAAKRPDGNPVDVLVVPASPYLLPIASITADSHIELGAQDVHFENAGAFTGEVSVEMLLDVGCTQVILGHSERRHVFGESDETVGKKVAAALSGGLKAILCVGELLSEREAGETESVLDRQMAGGLANIDEQATENVVIAYEPVWAIGTGVTASPDQAESAHDHLRKWLANRYNSEVADRTRILYGGSVKPENASEMLGQPNVDGALVGGASLKADQFNAIIKAAVELAGS